MVYCCCENFNYYILFYSWEFSEINMDKEKTFTETTLRQQLKLRTHCTTVLPRAFAIRQNIQGKLIFTVLYLKKTALNK